MSADRKDVSVVESNPGGADWFFDAWEDSNSQWTPKQIADLASDRPAIVRVSDVRSKAPRP